jgi:hypothetical protein
MSSTTPAAAPRARFLKINPAAAYSGRSRGRLYELAHQHPDLFRKDGKSTLVDVAVLDKILDDLPKAEIAEPWRFKKKKEQPQPQPKPPRPARRRRSR